MLFNSYEFLLAFLPITWLMFAGLRRWARAEMALSWLVAASWFFYAWWNPPLLLLFWLSLGVNYLLAARIVRPGPQALRKLLTAAGVVFNVGMIGYFKYAGFLVEVAGEVSGAHLHWHDTVLPLAISFYSFQKIAFLVDMYRRGGPLPRFLDYCLFISFFPQLIAGPIVRHDEIIPQLQRRPLRLTSTQLAVGASLISIGLAKKILLADRLGDYFNAAQVHAAAGVTLGLVDAWIAMSSAALHIYYDYSAYSDLAIGLALLFGIRLPLNFYSPYQALTVSGFWRRWNMTLMRFLRDHIYIPMGGSRHGLARQCIAIFTTMSVCGLWHGAGWNYLAWGAVVGAILSLSILVRRGRAELRRTDLSHGEAIARRALVFCAYVFPLCLFVSPQIGDGLRMAGSMLGIHGLRPASVVDRTQLAWLGAGFFALYALPNCYTLFARFRPTLPPPADLVAQRSGMHWTSRWRWRVAPGWAVLSAVLLAVALAFLRGNKEFYYFDF